MEKATDSLRSDHEAVSLILDIMEAVNKKIEAGKKVEPGDLNNIVKFLTDFADGYHHAKEESFLFPALEAAGMPTHGGPVGIMLQEHERGRATVEEIVKSAKSYNDGNQSALEEFKKASAEYVFVLRQHVDKENNILFMMADAQLDQFTQADMLDSFDEFLENEIGEDRYNELLSILNVLKEKYLK